MKVVCFGDDLFEKWDECCDASSQAWLYHRADWISVECQFLGAQNLSFAIAVEDAYVAVQPLYSCELGLGKWTERLVHSGLHRLTGLACRDRLSSSVVQMIRATVMARIESVAAQQGADRIQLNVQNLAPRSLTLEREEIPFWVMDHGFLLGLGFGPMGIQPAPGVTTCAADQIVDLSGTEDELFAALDASCRRAVRKAEEHHLTLEPWVGDLEQAIESYFALAVESAKRTGEGLAPVEYFRHIAHVFGPQGRLAVLLCKREGQLIAALLLGIEKGCATFMGGVSDPNYLNARPNDFVHWSAIKWAKAHGLCRYRLGPIFPEVPADWPIAKVSRFKKKFGGASFSTIQGSHFLSPAKYMIGEVK